MLSKQGEKAAGIFFILPSAALLVILVVLTVSGCQQLATDTTELSPPPGAELFRTKCSKCHDPERALKTYRSEEVWYETIRRMKEAHSADITKGEIDLLVKYHLELQQQETAVFKEKCQKCHPGKVFLEQKLTPDQARAIIRRMQQKAGNSIEDKDIEIIVNYHVRAQQSALNETLSAILGKGDSEQPDLQEGLELFLQKCSSCHNPERALSVIKDPEVWTQTVKRMQQYSKGEISDSDAEKLVDFHVNRQQEEINTFQETCTKCHNDDRINSRSMSEEQWLATIRRMQQKAPELISDEKVNLLAAYFHRRELTLAKIFSGKCQLCHYYSSGKTLPLSSTQMMNGLVASANNEFGNSLEISDIKNLLSVHVQRQQRNMAFYENDCNVCHTDGLPVEVGGLSEKNPDGPSRADWISFIAALKGEELSKETQKTINSEIDFHISRH